MWELDSDSIMIISMRLMRWRDHIVRSIMISAQNVKYLSLSITCCWPLLSSGTTVIFLQCHRAQSHMLVYVLRPCIRVEEGNMTKRFGDCASVSLHVGIPLRSTMRVRGQLHGKHVSPDKGTVVHADFSVSQDEDPPSIRGPTRLLWRDMSDRARHLLGLQLLYLLYNLSHEQHRARMLPIKQKQQRLK